MFKKNKYYVCIKKVNSFYKEGVIFKVKGMDDNMLVQFIIPYRKEDAKIYVNKKGRKQFSPHFKQILKRDISLYAL